jgi:hypothetical protein
MAKFLVIISDSMSPVIDSPSSSLNRSYPHLTIPHLTRCYWRNQALHWL